MPNIAQAKKRVKQNEKANLRNRSQRSEMRTLIKMFLIEIKEQNLDSAKAAFQKTVKRLQQLAGKKVIKKNKAARLTSRMNKKLKVLATS